MKRFTATVVFMGSSAMALCAPIGGAAWAQATAVPQAPAGAEQAGEASGLQDIVVTAQRRTERAQDVPISITTIAPAAIERQGIQSGFELTKAVPGLVFSNSSGFATPFIRGIGSTNAQYGDEASVATYIDGVYTPNRVLLAMPYGTVSSVEVLKGPQGTLFGRNAVGGVINVTLRGPERTFGGNASVSYDNFRTIEGTVFVTGPLSEKASASLDIQLRNQERGFFRNVVDSKHVGFRDYATARGKLRLEPSDALTIDLSADYQHSKYDLNNLSGSLPGTLPLAALVTTVYPKNGREVFTDVDPNTQLKSYGGSATIALDLGGPSLKSISSFRRVELYSVHRIGFVPIGTSVVVQPNPGQVTSTGIPVGTRTVTRAALNIYNHIINPYTITQEFQLASEQGHSFEWIVGAFAQWSKEGSNDSVRRGLWLDYRADPLLPDVAYPDTSQGTKAYAAFAQGTFHLAPQLSLVGGLRYSTETKTAKGNLVVAGRLADTNNQRKTFDGVSYRFGVNYEPNEQTLLYASASRGFKSGLFTPLSFRGNPIKPEKLDDFEVGAKVDLSRNLRFNLNGFHYIYKNQQVNAILPNGLSSLLNAASSKLTGGELEIEAAPVSNLTLGLSGSYIHARYKSFANAQAFIPSASAGYYQDIINASGNPVIQTPTWTGKGSANYRIDLANGSAVNLGANYYRSGSFSWDYSNLTRNRAYGILDLSLEWASADQRYSVLIYGNNVTNTKYAAGLTQSVQGSLTFPGRPAVIGGRFRIKFD